MKKIKIGDYVRWWIKEGDYKKSYAGTVIEERPGWNYRVVVFCLDGKNRAFSLSTVPGTYEPEYINWTAEIEGKSE